MNVALFLEEHQVTTPYTIITSPIMHAMHKSMVSTDGIYRREGARTWLVDLTLEEISGKIMKA